MKTIRTILVVLALANLVAILAFVGWLVLSDRLDMERVRRVRDLVSPTIAEEQQGLEAVVEEQLEADRITAVAEREAGEMLSSAMRISEHSENVEVERSSLARRESELHDLLVAVERERRTVERRYAELIEREEEHAAYLEELARTVGTKQFKSALDTLSAQKPAAAMAILQSLLDGGKRNEVISYLAAMQTRTRAKIFAEFEKEDPALAGDLLERLRTRGVVPSPDENPADGDPTNTATADGAATRQSAG